MKALIHLAAGCILGIAIVGCAGDTAATKTEKTVTTPDGQTKTTTENKVEVTPSSETKTTTEKVETSGQNPPPAPR